MPDQRRTAARRVRRAVRRARGGGASRSTMVMVLVVLLIASAVIGGVLWQAVRKDQASRTPIPAVTSAPDDVLVSFDAATASVLVGPAEAPSAVHVYEDFLCPACRRFEDSYGERIYDAVQAGDITVSYHLLNLLDRRSDPPGYSLRAANAALAVAAHSAPDFPDYHRSLFAAQPEAGSSGYTDAQLIGLARRLGATDPDVAEAIRNGAYTDEIERALRNAQDEPALRRGGSDGQSYFAVPTVTVDGRLVTDIRPGWLDAISSA